MRKMFLAAGTAAFVLGLTGIANAQEMPKVDATASVSPTKAGTKSKPKAEKLKLSVKNDPASKTTAAKITITLPSTLKLSTKGLDECKASDDALLGGPEKVCKKSIADKNGKANAVLNPFAAPAPLAFKVVTVVSKGELRFVLTGAANAVLHGKIKGSKMTIEIPGFLQQPAPGTFSALQDLSVNLSLKKGKNSLVSSTGCKGKKHKIGVQVGYVPNPSPPAASSAKDTAEAKCS